MSVMVRRWVLSVVAGALIGVLVNAAVALAQVSGEETPPHIGVLLYTLLEESGEEFSIRMLPEGGGMEVRLSSAEQMELARQIFSPVPSEVLVLLMAEDLDRAWSPLPGFTYVFTPPKPWDWDDGGGTGLSNLSYAPAAERVGPDWTQLIVILGVLGVGMTGGAVCWRKRIGLQAFFGIVAFSVGALVAVVALLGDLIIDSHPGFGFPQVVAAVVGADLAAVGLVALKRGELRPGPTPAGAPQLRAG